MKQTANILTVLLAVLAAVIAARLAMGLNAWVCIEVYWLTVTLKWLIEAVGRLNNGRKD